MRLDHIRADLDVYELLSFGAFKNAGGLQEDPYTCTESGWHTNYLHYLAFMGRTHPLLSHLEAIRRNTPQSLQAILNDTNFYNYYYGTVLHTCSNWNASEDLCQLLINFGANPFVKDYYEEMPGKNWGRYIAPFSISSSMQENDLLGVCDSQDFTHVTHFLDTWREKNTELAFTG